MKITILTDSRHAELLVRFGGWQRVTPQRRESDAPLTPRRLDGSATTVPCFDYDVRNDPRD